MERKIVGIILAILLIAGSVLVKQSVGIGNDTPYLLTFPIIAICTIYGGISIGLLATILVSFSANYFFLYPFGELSIDSNSIFFTLIHITEGVLVVLLIKILLQAKEVGWRERERFLVTLRSIDDAVIVTDQEGLVTFVNPSALRFLGLDQEKVLRKKLTKIFKIFDVNNNKLKVYQSLKSNRESEKTEEIYFYSGTGKRYEIDYSVSPIKNRAGKSLGSVLIFRDVSQRKFIREGMGRIATIVNSSQDAIYSIDLKGKVKTWNIGAEKLFGFTEKEVLGKSLKSFTVPRNLGRDYDNTVKLIKYDNPVGPFETVRQTKTRELKEVLVSASPIYDNNGKVTLISVVTHDISRHKALEKELFQANRRFELATEAVNGLIYDWDVEKGTVFRSSGLERVTGFRPGEIPDKVDWWMSRIHPEDLEKLSWWKNLNFKTKGKYTVEYRFMNKAGKYVKLWDHGIMEKNNEGKPTRIIGSAIDFSEKEEQEQRKNEFIGMASHELKTPLTSLKVFTQLLQNVLKKDRQASHLLNRMNEQIDSLTTIVNDLLDVSKIESGKLKLNKTSFSLDKIVHEISEVIQATKGSHKIIVSGKLAENIYADKERINEVLVNLLTNAIKYSPNSNKVEVSIKKEGSNAVIKVQDFGIGIAEKNLPFLFDRFFRVYGDDKLYQGLGMGLFISSEIIKRHHGKIWVKSKKGQGTEFFFSLPIKHEN